MKKLVSLVLALTMCLALGAPALAEDAPAAGVTSGDGILPDAHAFFNEEPTHSEESITDGTMAVFTVKPEYAAAAYEYVELLKSGRFGLALNHTNNNDDSDRTTEYVFDYTGSRDVDEVSIYSPTVSTYEYGAVIIRINDWPSYGWCTMDIWFSDDLTVEDTGDRCTVTGIVDRRNNGFSGPLGSGGHSSGGSSGGGGGSSGGGGDDRGRQCSVCGGDGSKDCMTCGGKGYIEEYVSSPNYGGSTFGSSRRERPTRRKCLTHSSAHI